MSKPTNKTPAPAETAPPIDVEGENLSSVTTPTVDAPASTALATTPKGDERTLLYEGKLSEFYDKLFDIAAANPELSDNLTESMAYLVARVEGMEGNRQVPIPYINMRQGLTKEAKLPSENVKQGDLYTDLERIGPEVKLILLHAHNKRVKFTQGSDRPDCSSNDAVTGFKYGSCEACPYRARDEAAGIRAACSFGYAFAAVSTDFKQLYQIDFMKTSSGAGKKLLKLASHPQGIFSRSFKIYTSKEKNDKGEYWVFAVSPTGDKVTGAEYEAARILSQFFTARYAYMQSRPSNEDRAGGPLNATASASGAAHTEADADAAPDFSGAGL